MKFLSIDVGIKHLAYCLFDHNFSIIQWEVCNLCGDDIRCGCCNKKARFTKGDLYCCKHHAKNEKYLIPKYSFDEIKKKKLSELCEMYGQKKRTKRDLLQAIQTDLSNNYFDLVCKINASKINLVHVGRNLCKKLDTFCEIDYVLIENQIGPLANRMKTLQGMIMQYFIIKGCKHIKQISSSNKLGLFCTDKMSYKERKKLSVDITKNILLSNNLFFSWSDFFNKKGKKDDLADSFLQGISFFIKEKWINIDKYKLRLT